LTKETLEVFDITHFNEIHLFLSTFRKKLTGDNLKEIENSFLDIKNSQPIKVETNLSIFLKDHHYFVYVK